MNDREVIMLEEILNEYGFSVSVRKTHATEFKNDEPLGYTFIKE